MTPLKTLGAERGGAYLSCFLQLLVQHLRSCRASHLLVLLTMAIGSMAMSATFFIGDGALEQLGQDMEQLLGSQITITPDPGPNGLLLTKRASVSLQQDDLEALRKRVTIADHIVPHQYQRAKVDANGIEVAVMVEGMSPELADEKAFQPINGRGLSSEAEAGNLYECLVTVSLANLLHLTGVGRISVDGRLFAVVGTIPDPPQADSRFRIRVIIPFVTARLMYGKPGIYDAFVVTWNRPNDLEHLVGQIMQTLDDRLGPECYSLSSSLITAEKQKKVLSNVMVFGTAQALFCVLVASIGVANVMLATVVRRRREYAIRIAVGARKRDIFGLVLSESMLIGLLGGLLGVIAAAVLSSYVCQVLASRIHVIANLTPVFCLRGVVVSLAACGISGLLAGVFPALQIRRIDVLSNLYNE